MFRILKLVEDSCLISLLTHWGRDKMASISQTTFSSEFFLMKTFDFQLKKFVPKRLFNNIPALVQIMAWHRSGDKALSVPMMVSLPMHICITRPQWVTSMGPGRCGTNYIPRIRRIGGCYGFTSKPPAARHPPPAARNGVNAITQKPRDGLFSNLVYTLVVIVSWPD